ncbi:protein kinase [Microbacterium sp. ARD32]|uniref:protein kinase domain-containing protein n=1 Tax=Microbacterium sp. ARD32 TaxID=2962577 RepID=UPI0028828E85|nr:protein kinase [Microbacterium sp. ARD32]MDT0157717.1 protein kinase [Microbacterium sp. ARD32]
MSDEEWAPRPRSNAPAAKPAPARPAIVVPGYADLVEIAQGGDSIVYHARQVSLNREVAIKAVRISDASIAERFRREVEITVRLGRQHPHIVTVLDTTTAETGELCLIMDFHDLGSLHDRLQENGPLSVSEVVEAGTAVADALAFAHRAGVLHRDVKPQNILVLPTSFVLSDFGIARHTDADRTASLERFSYRHASPQVLDGLMPTEADDVWSLGSTMFTLLDGRAPFAGDDPDDDTALAYLRRVRLNERRTLRRDDLPDGLRDFIDRALAPERENRIATAEQALAMLRGIRTEGRSWQPDAVGETAAADAGGETAAADAGGETGAPDAEPSADTHHADTRPDEAAPADEGPAGEAPADEAPADEGPAAADDTRHTDDAAGATHTAAAASGIRSKEQPGAPGPADDRPVARSALADLERPQILRASGSDDDATGTLVTDAEPDQARTEPSGSKSTWRRTVIFLAGMLIAGGIIGAVVAFLPHASPGDAPATAPSQDSVPTAPALPDDDGTQPTVSNPDFAPQDLVVTDRGTSALLTWAPPTGEVTSIAVVQLTDGESPVVLANLSGSATEFTVEGLDPDAKSCFAVAGYGTKDGAVAAGSTPQSCTP